MKNIGFIGCGNMGSAMLEGIMQAGVADGSHIYVANQHPEKLANLERRYGIIIANNETVARNSDVLFLAVKPYMYAPIIEKIRDVIQPSCIVVCIAAGITIENMYEMLGGTYKVVKAMPNTPSLVQEAMTAICFGDTLTLKEQEEMTAIFESFGECREVSESMMDVVTAISGSAPAYFFMMLEAMGDAGVKGGMSRDDAYFFAAQTMLGSAKMYLETRKHPGALKDMVTSPGGTTIEAVATLERRRFRASIIEAMDACLIKSEKMSQKQ